MINGLFGTDHPLDSDIEYHWTEFLDDDLRKTLADTIITVNKSNIYHIEAQMYEDDDIVMRVFDYGYKHSIRNRRESDVLLFPKPRIVYFGDAKKVPDVYTLTIDFGDQGQFKYKVKTFKYQEYSVEEINNKKMIILIPFELLRLRDLLKKDHSEENLSTLKKLIHNDIIGSIQMNHSVGNITGSDAGRLIQLTKLLYKHLYSNYTQMEVIEEMDESIILEYDHLDKMYEEKDKIYKEKDKAFQEMDKVFQEKEKAYQEKDKSYQEMDKVFQEKDKSYQEKDKSYQEKDKSYQEKDKIYQDTNTKLAAAEAEIARLKSELNKLTH